MRTMAIAARPAPLERAYIVAFSEVKPEKFLMCCVLERGDCFTESFECPDNEVPVDAPW